jgi:cell division protein FtsI/penicillin-binding protein 2
VSDRRANVRIRLLLLGFALLFAVAFARAAWIQVVRGPSLEAMASLQHRQTIEIPAGRGTIFDRTGEPLAIGEQAITVYADPRNVVAPKKAAVKAARALGLSADALYPKLRDRATQFLYVDRKADAEKARALEELGVAGFGFYPEERRVYPQGAVAANVLGFAGTDNFGLDGLERSLDKTLAGRPGFEIVVRDPAGRRSTS